MCGVLKPASRSPPPSGRRGVARTNRRVTNPAPLRATHTATRLHGTLTAPPVSWTTPHRTVPEFPGEKRVDHDDRTNRRKHEPGPYARVPARRARSRCSARADGENPARFDRGHACCGDVLCRVQRSTAAPTSTRARPHPRQGTGAGALGEARSAAAARVPAPGGSGGDGEPSRGPTGPGKRVGFGVARHLRARPALAPGTRSHGTGGLGA